MLDSNPTNTKLILQSMDNDSVIKRKSSNIWLRRIFGPVCQNDSEWWLRQNEELYELLDGLVTVKYIKLKKKLQ
jgi:hypothetical protein